MDYQKFLEEKTHFKSHSGITPLWIPDTLFDFQKYLVDWSIRNGRSAIFADCGLGKTPMQLVWAENIKRHTNGRILVLTPLSVASQTVREAEKFHIEARQSRDGVLTDKAEIVVTNYEKLHLFNSRDFAGCVCDESSILKNFDGATKDHITEFMKKMQFRLLCTATASPNDYIELGTSSEALGYLGYIDMLKMFFKSNDNSFAQGGGASSRTRFSGSKSFGGKFRFRGHSERDFWRWVCSWARACQKPSDCGFENGTFVLPELKTNLHIIKATMKRPDLLFDLPAVGLSEQREERRRTVVERCEKAAELVIADKSSSVSWCSLNDESDLLQSMIPDSVQVSGSDKDERKEEVFDAFSSGKIQSIITKPTIAGFGLNWQHCHHQTFFPSHSFEQFYQSVRRSWRFGQKNPVTVDIISSEGEADVLKNLQRKAAQSEVMFSSLVSFMNNELKITEKNEYTKKEEVPSWL